MKTICHSWRFPNWSRHPRFRFHQINSIPSLPPKHKKDIPSNCFSFPIPTNQPTNQPLAQPSVRCPAQIKSSGLPLHDVVLPFHSRKLAWELNPTHHRITEVFGGFFLGPWLLPWCFFTTKNCRQWIPTSWWWNIFCCVFLFDGIITPDKFNSLPLKAMVVWKTILSYWQGKFSGANCYTSGGHLFPGSFWIHLFSTSSPELGDKSAAWWVNQRPFCLPRCTSSDTSLRFACSVVGKNDKKILPKWWWKWWCTMVESVKHHQLKQIQEKKRHIILRGFACWIKATNLEKYECLEMIRG